MTYEWGIVWRTDPPSCLHRGPMTEDEACDWIQELVDEGVAGDAFYLVRREVGSWGRVV